MSSVGPFRLSPTLSLSLTLRSLCVEEWYVIDDDRNGGYGTRFLGSSGDDRGVVKW